jgi:hypothetical protein
VLDLGEDVLVDELDPCLRIGRHGYLCGSTS